MTDDRLMFPVRHRLALLVCFHVVVCCLSLAYAADRQYGVVDPSTFHLFYDRARLPGALVTVAAFALLGSVFAFGKFSFGYFAGFYLYTMLLGYLWLNFFTDLKYDHRLAGISAFASAIAFLLPAVLISLPLRQLVVLSATTFDRLLRWILLFAAATIAAAAIYNFRLVTIEHIYDFRDKLQSPAILNYVVGIVRGALLPFAFAGFVMRRAWWSCAAVLFLLLLLYPVTLSKLALFAPAWLICIAVLAKLLESRTATILSLMGPILLGLILLILVKAHAATYFFTVNIRMLAVPSVAMDVYNDFFSRNELTYFCQISVLKQIMHCPYQDQLSIVMLGVYGLGNFNASLFATEGIASVGPWLAPLSALLCGLVIALGNRLSAGLPARFVLISGAMLPPILLDVPLSIALVTHGMAILFLLWYITPRPVFGRAAEGNN
ncbi:MAG: hypothetical protein QOH32_3845 [Bradyrhizobium sp.]|jgi:hypothetical protein|nr:hypothetical protein [Bradyrhizobium sp.]